MRWSNYYIPTLKEAPADAEVISHKLLMRAGMIRRVAAGIYNYLPFGWRTIKKVEDIVREEMDRAGALECRLPAVLPGDLWRESGRWEEYGKELLRFVDRHDREYCLGPTHEEVITALMRGEVQSYRQLPLNLYQIQTKFRDEIRPRFGLMRGREFTMKDAYSFDKTDEDASTTYHKMFQAYVAIFTRLGLRFRAIEADSGSIGGSMSHEFAVLAETGEDIVISCTECEYAANIEKARSADPAGTDWPAPDAYEEVHTPNQHTVAEVVSFMGVTAQELIKTIILAVDDTFVAALVRGDRALNEIKVKNYFKATDVSLASRADVERLSNSPVGFAGPVGLKIPILADLELSVYEGWVTGANKADTHYKNVNLKRDANVKDYVDLRVVESNDACPSCGKPLVAAKGIEVGHVFKLGDKYSKAMNATFVDEQGKDKAFVMGCYGIGITRIVAAAIEQNFDEGGIIFPPAISPFDVLLLNLDPKDAEVNEAIDVLYTYLKKQGIDVLLDDREERPGVKFKDADLIGIPMQITLGKRSCTNGIVEIKDRRTGEKSTLPLAIDTFAPAFSVWQKTVLDGWRAYSLKA